VKIIKLTSEIKGFRPIEFNKDFSIVLGIPKGVSEGKSHNLGKTTLIALIDHILFGSRESDRIKAIKSNFNNPVFTIDLLIDGNRKSVTVDYAEKKKPVFEKDVKQAYEYFIRFQDDYKDEFRKASIRGKDITWKPLLLRLMGFDEKPLVDKYEIESTIGDYEKFIEIATDSGMKREGRQQEISVLEVRRTEILRSIDSLDFSALEGATSSELASNIDGSIKTLKEEIYLNERELAAINDALKNDVFVHFTPEKIEAMYADMQIYFGSQIKKDLWAVQEFFDQVSRNRASALSSMKRTFIERLDTLSSQLRNLSKKREQYLRLVVAPKSQDIYRELSKQLAQVESELSLLKLDVYKESIQTAISERNQLLTKQLQFAAQVAVEIDENDAKFRRIKEEYSKIMADVMDIDAEISIEKNSTGNINFLTTSWRDGVVSQELKGEMAKKVSCAAFDVALRIVNNDDGGFIIHDGVIDNADKNIKKRFIEAMRSRAKEYDFQYILTAISDDLPDTIKQGDIVLTLSDRSEGELLMGKSY